MNERVNIIGREKTQFDARIKHKINKEREFPIKMLKQENQKKSHFNQKNFDARIKRQNANGNEFQ